MRICALVMAAFGFLGGAVAFIIGSAQAEDQVVAGGSSIVVAALALAGVTVGLKTWRDDRRAKEVEERQRASSELLEHLMQKLAGGAYDLSAEARRRADLAVWGDVPVVAALARWNRVYDNHVPPEKMGTVELNQVAQREFQEATADVARAIRRQFNPADRTTTEQLRSALFNKPRRRSGGEGHVRTP